MGQPAPPFATRWPQRCFAMGPRAALPSHPRPGGVARSIGPAGANHTDNFLYGK
ncbi:hypothetical protein W822_21375 [Advenella kashmirensis W13003]|uniref:Uncharacterized protein n=1 Tax=Advenella kashmirensis W13003 TaxID=1424334 RepID=V8QLN4_9BURK|nr:hypothetical protein W822_21375 [Advenella kashmirensis W13003]